MRRAERWFVVLGFGLTLAGNAPAQTRESGLADMNLSVRVHNYAGIHDKTLSEAVAVSRAIFRQAGVETRWIDEVPANPKMRVSAENRPVDLTEITVNIAAEPLPECRQLPINVVGLAPGTGRDRSLVYIFYDRLEVMQMTAPFYIEHVRTSQVLGDAIAHEIGHVLLNMDGHSAIGIMRGNWRREELGEVARGRLVFTPQQAEVVRSEVRRRNTEYVSQLQKLGR